MPSAPRDIQRLAQLYGIQTSYQDMRGVVREASAESLIAVAQTLGAEIRSFEEVGNAIIQRETELWERAVEPVLVAWNGKVPPIRIRTRANTSLALSSELRLEDGSSIELDPRAGIALQGHHELGKVRYVEHEWTTGQRLPTGYHRLELTVGKKTFETLIIAAPTKAQFPFKGKEWGIFAPIYALHSRRNPNLGDLTDFECLMDWMRRYQGRVAATLPLLSAFLSSPFEPSPYSPASRLFWNELYVDVGKARRSTNTGLADYRREMRFRRGALEAEAEAFFNSRRHLDLDFVEFTKRETELSNYARFRAVGDKQGNGWTAWPARLRDGRFKAGDYDPKAERYHRYAQWRIQSQLGTMAEKARRSGQLLYLDLPLGLHPDSFDIWRYRDLFVTDAAGGAPPDPVFTQGQNWGFPPMHPEISRFHHYQYTIAYIRNHLRNARLLRIDHVMGLHRLFWIPRGFTGERGVYVQYPADELYAILCLESHRNQAGIVGENLGTVPPEVNAAMRRHNIQQMYVVQYELESEDPIRSLQSVPANAVASLNTHDMSPFRAFLAGLDIDDRLDLGFLDKKSAQNEWRRRAAKIQILVGFLRKNGLLEKNRRATSAAIFKATMRFLASTMANIVLVNIEDLWGETLPQNVPATQAERPNWRRRARFGLEQIQKSRGANETLRSIQDKRQ